MNSMKLIKLIIIYVVAGVIFIWVITPILWIILTSLKPTALTNVPSALLFEPTAEHYHWIFTAAEVVKSLTDSIVISLSAAILTVALASLSAYPLARFEFMGKDSLNFWFLTFKMGPAVSFAIPLFLIFVFLGLFDTHLALVLAYVLFNLPLALWLIREFYLGIPREIEEAAMLDGASLFQVYRRIILPLSAPGLVAAGILTFIFSWNEFLYALILAGTRVKTIPLLVASYWTMAGVLIGPMCATIVISIIPALTFCWLIQRYLVMGLTFGTVR